MANTLGTLSADIVTRRTFQFLRFYFGAFFRSISTDFSGESAKLNQQVVSRVATVPTVSSYSKANGYVAVDSETADVGVTINEHRHVTLAFDIEELTSTDRNLVDEQAAPAAYALGKDLVDKVLALITVANFSNETVETIANTQRSTLGTLRKALNTDGVNPMSRFALFNGDAFEKLTDDQRIVSAEFNQGGAGQVNRAIGHLQNINGFAAVHEWPDLATAESLTGFAGVRDALVLATRLPRDPAVVIPNLPNAAKVEIIRDPETGAAIMVRTWYDNQKGKLYFSLVWMFGVSVGIAGSGRRVVHTATPVV